MPDIFKDTTKNVLSKKVIWLLEYFQMSYSYALQFQIQECVHVCV